MQSTVFVGASGLRIGDIMGHGDLDDAIGIADIWQTGTIAVPVQLDLEAELVTV